jgi:serine/threonine-protein kinase
VAHEAGVIHRDLKPANVFLCKPEEGEGVFVKLLDFGVAKAAMEHEDTQATRAGMVFGTPGYMSPEQILADSELDARADLWSVAVLAYRMTVGRTPFGAGSMSELGLRILTTHPALPSSVRPELPKAFDTWMKKGLAKRREERFGTALELAEALAAVASVAGAEPAPEPLAARLQEPAGVGEDSTYGPLYRSEAAPSMDASGTRRTRLLLVAGALLVALVVALSVAIQGGPRAGAASTPAAAPLPTAKARPAPVHVPASGAPEPARSGVAEFPPAPSASARAGPPPPVLSTAVAGPATATRAPRSRAPGTKTKARVEAVEKRANELWNKKDEL